MVDVMVLGNSLQEHGVKAEKLLCINEDTEKNSIAHLMRSFWQFAHVQHVQLPRHLRGSEQARLQGVYSKLQTVNIFSEGPMKQQRFLLMDADMLVRSNLDDLFACGVPAGVMRGETDTCLFEPRPSHTFFHKDTTMRPGDSHPQMKGGINGGLVLFEPSAETYEDMMRELHDFRPQTKMAEQEFLSYYYGRSGSWHAMHKKNNFQLHQMYFANPEAPLGQDRQSSFAYMVDHPQEIRVFHFSADQKPSDILISEMSSVQGWLSLEEHLEKHARYMMDQHGSRSETLQDNQEWITKIEKLLRDANLEWFEAWKRTYVNVVSFVMETAYNKMVRHMTDGGEHVYCQNCGAQWHIDDFEEESSSIRDHLLFNCPSLASEIKILVKHQTNLLTFFFVPCGAQVESKLLYLAEVYKFHVGVTRPSRSMLLPPLSLNPSQQPQILHPLYMIPKFILATTEDRGVDASTVTAEEPEATLKIMQRRYQRAMVTLRQPDNIFCFRNDPKRAAQWTKTLTTVSEAGTWLIKHEESITAFTHSKAQGSIAASSSSAPPAEAPTILPPLPGGTPPWRQHEPSQPLPKARPVAHSDMPALPPPPPSSRRS